MQWEGAQQPVVVRDSWRRPTSSHAAQPFHWTGIAIFTSADLHAAQGDTSEPAIATSVSCRGEVGAGAESH
eukprot:6630828-Alexandrium_andersonii.AAC.1